MINEEQLKIPPHSIEAEQSVLGGLMLDNQAWWRIADRVVETDFYRRDHQIIFSALKALAENDKPCDIITVSEWLEARNRLEAIGGLAYLGGIAKNTPSAANIVTYADIVKERAVLRELVRVGTDIANSAFETEGRTPDELVDNAERSVMAIGESAQQKGGFQHTKNVMSKVIDMISERFENQAPIGLKTGFADIDKKIGGLTPGQLIIVAGRPSMGKTAYALNIAEHVGLGENSKPVAVFSLEMPAEDLVMRSAASLAKIDSIRMRDGDLDDSDFSRLSTAVSLHGEGKMFIQDAAALTISQIKAQARRLHRQHKGLALIIIDYLQLAIAPGNDNRVNEVAEISRGLKALAKDLAVPVIALSQLNRSLEQRTNKRPIMADLRESGSIEQDADVIMFVYRDEVYDEDSPDKGTAEIIIAKQRNGPIGTVRLAYRGEFTRFENFAKEY